ncbi:hypothetical protein GCM10022222_82060 [Amycolatopsis ultiminotia]|uniref:DUF4185 domain-containing protein n=1 Tax=Amycolatopsis ultiminotia TaxID=543629 RepID=A0ABP6YM91_9PSEU
MNRVHRRRFLGLAAGSALAYPLAGIASAEGRGGKSRAADPGGFVYPAPGQSTGTGVLPATPASVEYLGRQDYGTDVARDLGFSGVVNGQSVWTFGDTLVPDGNGGYALSASDSVGLGDMSNPLRVYDRVNSSGWPDEWIPLTDEENANGGLSRYGMGGTNVVEYAPNQGLVWYLKNDRGTDGKGILGAGVATVTADANAAYATRVNDTMWGATEPWWGENGVTYNALDGKVYVYGHGPDPFGANTYLARADATKATDVSAYEYWDQSSQAWGQQRFSLGGELGTVKLSDAQAIFTDNQLGQSNAFWSNYYNTWMWVAGANLSYSDIRVLTAPKLEGPWTDPVTVASSCPDGNCGLRYAMTPHPEYDPSGATILVTWTDSNVIYTVRIHWK